MLAGFWIKGEAGAVGATRILAEVAVLGGEPAVP
jgi:hypothetical protein